MYHVLKIEKTTLNDYVITNEKDESVTLTKIDFDNFSDCFLEVEEETTLYHAQSVEIEVNQYYYNEIYERIA